MTRQSLYPPCIGYVVTDAAIGSTESSAWLDTYDTALEAFAAAETASARLRRVGVYQLTPQNKMYLIANWNDGVPRLATCDLYIAKGSKKSHFVWS